MLHANKELESSAKNDIFLNESKSERKFTEIVNRSNFSII